MRVAVRIFKKIILAMLCVFISPFSDCMICNFIHCNTSWERNRLVLYSSDTNGKTRLSSDLSKFIELKLSNEFVIPWDESSKSVFASKITDAVSTMLKTPTGYELLKILITKLSLRREATLCMNDKLNYYIKSIKRNDLVAAANALYDLARVYIGSTSVAVSDVNKSINVLSSVSGFKAMLDSMLLESGWETRCSKFLSMLESKSKNRDSLGIKGSSLDKINLENFACIVDPYVESARMLQLLSSYFNTTKIQITDEQMDAGHCFYISPDEKLNVINIYSPALKDLLVYALPKKQDRTFSGKTVRIFEFPGEPDQKIEFDACVLSKRNVTFDEVLFHELGHCLHITENRSDIKRPSDPIEFKYTLELNSSKSETKVFMKTNISNDLTNDWIDHEELRNGTGIVIMENCSLQKDAICTYKYDLENSRTPRWPYRDISTKNVSIGDFIEYIESFFHN